MATDIGVPSDTSGSAVPVNVEPVTSLNGATVTQTHLQRFIWSLRTAAGIAVDIPGDAVNGPKVDVQRMPIAGTATTTIVAVTAGNGVVLIAAAARRGLQIFNDSTQRLRVKYGSTVPVSAPFVVPIAPGGYWEMPFPIVQDHVTGVWDGAESDTTKTGANITQTL